MDNPCYNCPDRRVGCHVDCERRAQWLENHLAEKREENRARQRDVMLNSHMAAARDRIRRSHRNRKKG